MQFDDLRNDCDGDTPLHDAISSQNTTLVELLLRHNPDLTILNNAGQNSLHCATVHGGTEHTLCSSSYPSLFLIEIFLFIYSSIKIAQHIFHKPLSNI
ncbi:unnamed protein product [Schistosoma margrebowiei]|uniref:Uncharacterized protein n=1 Tax=Schistosoma margrebowiei TaxID=48269 RepID=A0A183MWF8_9TREM|nr:unnamed protein product [Schistosoma margrebowiei]